MAQEKGGLMAAIGQTIAGPRFYETDEVGRLYTQFLMLTDALNTVV